MKIVNTLPPNYEILSLYLNPPDHAVYCYGDTIYNPSGKKLTPDIEHHESIHSKQQGDDVDGWYTKYLQDKEFRLKQEISAYGEQYNFIKEHIQNSKLLKWGLEKMAEALSSEAYGNLLSYGEAESKIRNYTKFNT